MIMSENTCLNTSHIIADGIRECDKDKEVKKLLYNKVEI